MNNKFTQLTNKQYFGTLATRASNLFVADTAIYPRRYFCVRNSSLTARVQVIQDPYGEYLRHSTSGLKLSPPKRSSKPSGGVHVNANRGG